MWEVLRVQAANRVVMLGVLSTIVGCGTTQSQRATEQLLMSEAVDDSVSGLDFRSLSGEKVYLDTSYLKNVKGFGFVNADYIVSSVRQQMIAADCRLQEDRAEADFVVEARIGALGTDGNDIIFGLPANNVLNAAATLAPNAPTLPTIPEISFARKEAQVGAAKVAVFAYERETGRPVWQSGTMHSRSTAQNWWVLGAGPFQRGTIYDGTHFAGSDISLLDDDAAEGMGPPIAHREEYLFPKSQTGEELVDGGNVSVASFESDSPPEPEGNDDGEQSSRRTAEQAAADAAATTSSSD